MHKYRTVLLDLDGTIVDSAQGVFNGIEYALSKINVTADRNTFYRFMGPPLRETFSVLLKDSNGDIEKAVKDYREYYSDKGIKECELYEGMREALKFMFDEGIKLCLATSKPEKFAIEILQNLDVAKYFAFIGGATLDDTRGSKKDVIEYVLQSAQIDKASAVMIGDRDTDLRSASICGMDSIGVLFGYGSSPELEACNPVYLASSAKDMCHFICNK